MNNVNFNARSTQQIASLLQAGTAVLVTAVALRNLLMENKDSESVTTEVKDSSFSFGYTGSFLAISLLGIVAACLTSIASRLKNKRTTGLEINYLTHENFLHLLKKLYPDYEAAGLCSGYSITVTDDLLEESSNYRASLRKLDSLMGNLSEVDLIRNIKEDKNLSIFLNKINTNYNRKKKKKTV